MKEILRPGYGQVLADARAGKNMSLADVAAKIKLTVRQVEAMEAEDTAHLPGDVFLRGFVRNYARLVDVDPEELITPMDAQAAVSETITAPSEGVAMSTGGLRRWVLVPLIVLAVFVLFVAILYQWLRQGEDALVSQTVTETAPGPVTQTVPVPAPVPAPAPATSESEPAVPAATPGPEPLNPSPVTVSVPSTPPTLPPAKVFEKPAAPPAPAVPKPTPLAEEAPAKAKVPVSGGSPHVLRFQATQDAWIQVVDGDGKRFSKLIRAGGNDSIAGAAPFKLVVGEAAQVHLTYDGHPIDLSPFIGQKVARLTLE